MEWMHRIQIKMNQEINSTVIASINALVIDDDAFMLKIMQRILNVNGIANVTCCESGQSGLDALKQAQEKVDLILLDLNMPEMDGIQFVRQLDSEHFKGSIILISGEDERMLISAEKLVAARHIGILGHLQKPVTQEALLPLLKQLGSQTIFVPLSLKTYSAESLATAIGGGQLFNTYQPIVSLKTGKLSCVEVLVRWNHPTDGLVGPDQFIPVAEDNNLIDQLASVVLTEALEQHKKWQEMSLHIPMAINVSMENLASLEFADNFSKIMVDAGLLTKDITLEITESRAMKDPMITLDTLARLRLKRFVLSIDDFGTGHSSLAQLRDIPFDEFKIDRSFVTGAWADKRIGVMFETSLNLAKRLSMKVVAEGIESEKDWEFVRSAQCDYAQGYFIAKPMAGDALPKWLSAWGERVRRELLPETNTATLTIKASKQGTVLIIEDHEFQRRIQSKILTEEGFSVVTAATSAEALSLLRTLRPTLILIDIELPGMSGLEILKRLRSTAVFKTTPVVMLSGSNQKDIVVQCMKTGATGFIAKPFDRKTLVAKVASVLPH
ncbi:MAG: EAL domain-containing protein [Cellvibrio sp.]|uniref:EAL domain-containing protein n=1 Tax=Cellvibrio sp. TaxID=1965322 RepID=UPI0027192385|nr:EAL domain-containing protein [Cellvibrio sp.]